MIIVTMTTQMRKTREGTRGLDKEIAVPSEENSYFFFYSQQFIFFLMWLYFQSNAIGFPNLLIALNKCCSDVASVLVMIYNCMGKAL